DTHTGANSLREELFFSKAGMLDGTPELRGSVPASFLTGTYIKWSDPGMVTEVDGSTYMATSSFEYWSASGVAAVWAEENTREAIYAAFRRKETFATSGPRMKVRFFAGYDYDEAMLQGADLTSAAYAGGVTMGSDLNSDGDRSPAFIVWAMADSLSAPLDRVQVIKGFLEDGEHREQVYDVACSGGAAVDPSTWRCPDNGARVDLTDCSTQPGTGSGELKTLWRDPAFKPGQDAFYYVRVLENPTCRWSTWDAIRAGEEPRSDLHATIQERAWSSPIWYRPAGQPPTGTDPTATDPTATEPDASEPPEA
ncbi:MAG: DUF3604 domain-containing protein, partial [Halioglobus sp.]